MMPVMDKKHLHQKASTQTKATPPDLDGMMVIKSFCARYPDLVTEPQIRWQIFNREINGLSESGAIVKKGGRWVVVVPRYRDWILSGER